MSLTQLPVKDMILSHDNSVKKAGTDGEMGAGHTGQQLHVSGVFIILLELALVVENIFPILVVVIWLPVQARGVGDRLVAAFSVTCILSALVPTPLGLASYFTGSWYGGVATCTTYQVTSTWCGLSSLVLLTYICLNCHVTVRRLVRLRTPQRCPACHRSELNNTSEIHGPVDFVNSAVETSAIQDCERPYCNAEHSKSICRDMRQDGSSKEQLPQTEQNQIDRNEVKKLDPRLPFSPDSGRVFDYTENSFVDVGSEEELESVLNPPLKVTIEKCGKENDTTSLKRLSNKPKRPKTKTVSNGHIHNQEQSLHDDIYSNALNDTLPETGHVADRKQNKVEMNKDLSPKSTSIQNGKRNIHISSKNRKQTRGIRKDTNIKETSNIPVGNCVSESYNETGTEDKAYLNEIDKNSVKAAANTFDKNSAADSQPCGVYNNYGTEICSENNLIGNGGISFHGNVNECAGRDFMSLALFLLFSVTLGVSSLPVAGLGPSGTPHGDKSCRSWLVPTPNNSREKVFFISFLTLVYLCLVLGCGAGISVCLQVSRRMKMERKRKSRLYHEEEDVPDLSQLYALECMRRHYSMACIVTAGILTWLPSALMLTLQKVGVEVSEPTLMYSNITTALPGLLNPLLYSLALARYRSGYKAIIEKCCCKRRKLKPHHLKGVHTRNGYTPSVSQVSVDVTLTSTPQGHLCQHGLANPAFSSELDQLLRLDQDDELDEDDEDIADNDDDDDDEDDAYLQDGDEDESSRNKSQRLSTLKSQLNEKTPLQAVSVATAAGGQSFRTVLATRSSSNWTNDRDTWPSDREALLVCDATAADDETGL